jgi:hypothetical protein
MGSGSEERVVERESDRLLRQWWNEPGDYSWLVEFLGRRGFLTGLQVIMGIGGLLMGTVNAASPGRQQDETPVRSMQLDGGPLSTGPLGTRALLSTDGA